VVVQIGFDGVVAVVDADVGVGVGVVESGCYPMPLAGFTFGFHEFDFLVEFWCSGFHSSPMSSKRMVLYMPSIRVEHEVGTCRAWCLQVSA